MPYDINSQQIDIENLFKQNELDLSSIKELYRKLEKLEEKITQIKYIDSKLADKLKKDYEKLKRIILDENIQAKLTNDINEIDTSINIINNDINEIDTSINNINNDINVINSQMDNIVRLSSNFKRQIPEAHDSPRFQRAIDKTSSLGVTLQIDEPLLLRETVIIKDNTSLFSNSINAKITTDQGSSRNGMILLLGENKKNITIKGLFLEGLGYGETEPSPAGTVQGSGSGIMLANCENIVIDSCTVTKCGGYKGNEGVGNIWLSCCKHAKIINNTIYLGGNLICVDRWYSFNQGKNDIYNLDIVISNNNLFWCSGRGIALENINDNGNISIIGNTFSGIGYSAIEGRSFINTVITGNVIDGNLSLKINPNEYFGLNDENWNWNNWDNTQFGIEVVSDIWNSIIADNCIRNIKNHGVKTNNILNTIISNNILTGIGDVGVYIKNATTNTENLEIIDNIIKADNYGVYLTKDTGNQSIYNGVIIKGNDITSKKCIYGIDMDSPILNSNNLKPITNYSGSIGISLVNPLNLVAQGNVIKNFTRGYEIYNDNSSWIKDRLINNTTHMYIEKGTLMIIESYFSGGTTAINNTQTTYCYADKSIFVNIANIKTGHGIKLEREQSMTNTTGNIPTNGVWSIGDIIKNSTPLLGTPIGIICIGNSSTGTVGQWKSLGLISEN